MRALVAAFGLLILSDVILFATGNQPSPSVDVYGRLTGILIAVASSVTAAVAGVLAAVALTALSRTGDERRQTTLIVAILAVIVFFLALPVAIGVSALLGSL